ncbi:MAG: hypothetical protein RLZZ156_877 [Deinococcota bacterium]
MVRVSKSSGGFPIPLSGVKVETLRLESPHDMFSQDEVLYVCLESEVVIDMGLDFAHLRPLEAFTVRGAHKLSPVHSSKSTLVGVCVLLRITKG